VEAAAFSHTSLGSVRGRQGFSDRILLSTSRFTGSNRGSESSPETFDPTGSIELVRIQPRIPPGSEGRPNSGTLALEEYHRSGCGATVACRCLCYDRTPALFAGSVRAAAGRRRWRRLAWWRWCFSR